MRIRRSPLLDTGSRTVVPTLVAVSLFLLVVGHDNPGGGFIAGLVAGAGLLVVFLTGGREAVVSLVPVAPGTLVGIGMAVAVVTAGLGLVLGEGFLDAGKLSADLPAVGTISVGSAVVFDAGVYLVVVGLVATIVISLGSPKEAPE